MIDVLEGGPEGKVQWDLQLELRIFQQELL